MDKQFSHLRGKSLCCTIHLRLGSVHLQAPLEARSFIQRESSIAAVLPRQRNQEKCNSQDGTYQYLCRSNIFLTGSDSAPTRAPSVLQITSSASALPSEYRYWPHSISTLRIMPIKPVSRTRKESGILRGSRQATDAPKGQKRRMFRSRLRTISRFSVNAFKMS